MSEIHILQLNPQGEPSHIYLELGEHSKPQVKTVSGWGEVKKGVSWTLLLPAAWVYQTETQVPSKSTEVLKQSIPFAVEEEISNDVEDNYYAFKAITDQLQKVSVISKAQLKQIKEQVQKHQIQVNHIYSEVDFCPKENNTVTVWQQAEKALLCFGLNNNISVVRGQLADMLPVFAADFEYVQSNQDLADEDIVHLKRKPAFSLAACFAALKHGSVVDVMPQDWLRKADSGSSKPGKTLLLLLCLLILSWAGIKTYQHYNVNQQLEATKEQQLTLFKQRFGDASGSELSDPFAALQSRLQRINQSQSATSPLIEAIHYLGVTMQKHRQHIDIMSLRLVEQKLEIQLTAESMTQINAFQQSLQQAAMAYKVLIGVNEQDAGRFKSVITMERL